MKKIFSLLVALLLLSGCAESIALLGPASTSVTGGNIAQSSFSSAMSYGVKKQTGKSPVEHAMAYAEEKTLIERKNLAYLLLKKLIQKFVQLLKNN